jgi:hypothetical protein
MCCWICGSCSRILRVGSEWLLLRVERARRGRRRWGRICRCQARSMSARSRGYPRDPMYLHVFEYNTFSGQVSLESCSSFQCSASNIPKNAYLGDKFSRYSLYGFSKNINAGDREDIHATQKASSSNSPVPPQAQ